MVVSALDQKKGFLDPVTAGHAPEESRDGGSLHHCQHGGVMGHLLRRGRKFVCETSFWGKFLWFEFRLKLKGSFLSKIWVEKRT